MVLKRKNQPITFFSLALLFISLNPSFSKLETSLVDEVEENNIIHVGAILDMGSWMGKIGHSCISMAISDFYTINRHYKTRLVLHAEDSRGDPFIAFSTAIKLMKNMKIEAIIGAAETPTEANLLAELGVRAEVPVISFLPTGQSLSLAVYPYSVQFTQDETSQIKGIASVIEAFGWRNVILVYEDTVDCQELMIPLISCLQDFDIHVARKISIKAISSVEEIKEQLYNASITLQIGVFVVHMSPSLASLLFLNAKKIGMMSEGYVWMVTDKTMNLLNSMELSVIESMQGVLGFKPYIPPTKELQNFTSRWKRSFFIENPNIDLELNVYGTWAYDAIWALAMAAERARIRNSESENRQATNYLNMMDLANIQISQSGSIIREEMLQIRFNGLSGKVQFKNGRLNSKVYEIINVVGKGERRVGFWTQTNNKTLNPSNFETIIWPGGSTMLPKHRLLQTRYKKLKIGVPPTEFKALVNIGRDPRTNATIVTGFCIDVFKAVIEALPYQVDYEFIPFANASGKMAGTYNQLVDQVFYQKYDAVVGDVTITANRSLYVDFTLPFTDLGYAMVVRKINSNDMWIFLKPLSTGLWLTTAAFCIVIGLVVWVIERPVNEDFQGSASQQIGTTLWFAFSILVFAHRERLSSNLSKLVVIVWIFVVLILTSSYTATLASMLTVQQIQLLQSSKRPSIGWSEADYMLPQVKSNLNFAGSTLRTYGSPHEYAEALSRGSKDGGISAVINEIPYLKIFLSIYPNQYSMTDITPDTNGFAFVLRKGSPLVDDMSREIARLREEGKLRMMEDAWFKSDPRSIITGDDTNNGPNALSLDSFGGLFIISAVTTASAIFIFFIFLLAEKWHHVGRKLRHLFSDHSQSIRRFLSNKVLASWS